ncbi:unnamed protein product [Scytosiphon promiscuus]
METTSGRNEDHVGIPPATPATERGDAEEERALVVVTGGSKGIGRSCVASFARRGARVLFTYCSDAAGARAVEQSFEPPGRVQCRRLDQGDFDSVVAFAVEVDQWREGREISTVVNNAALGVATVSSYGGLPHPGSSRPTAADAPTGGGEGGRSQEHDDAARRRAEEDVALMRVNALGPLWVTEALLPMMVASSPSDAAKEQRGDSATSAAAMGVAPKNQPRFDGDRERAAPIFPPFTGNVKKRTVLFVGSVGGGSQAVFPGFRAADAMSKAAVAYASKHFASRSRAAALDGGETASAVAAAAGSTGGAATAYSDPKGGVDFVCLCPGATLTDMFRASTLDKMEAKGPGELERFLRALPQGRLMLPDEVGEAVYWLCSSPAATMFHGAVIDASAGLAVRPGALTEYSF